MAARLQHMAFTDGMSLSLFTFAGEHEQQPSNLRVQFIILP